MCATSNTNNPNPRAGSPPPLLRIGEFGYKHRIVLPLSRPTGRHDQTGQRTLAACSGLLTLPWTVEGSDVPASGDACVQLDTAANDGLLIQRHRVVTT